MTYHPYQQTVKIQQNQQQAQSGRDQIHQQQLQSTQHHKPQSHREDEANQHQEQELQIYNTSRTNVFASSCVTMFRYRMKSKPSYVDVHLAREQERKT